MSFEQIPTTNDEQARNEMAGRLYSVPGGRPNKLGPGSHKRSRIQIMTPQEHAAMDPRGLERVTIIGETVFRKVWDLPSEVEGSN